MVRRGSRGSLLPPPLGRLAAQFEQNVGNLPCFLWTFFEDFIEMIENGGTSLFKNISFGKIRNISSSTSLFN